MKKLKGLLSAFLGISMLFGTAVSVSANESTANTQGGDYSEDIDFSAQALGLNVAAHSRDIIREYINGHPFDMDRPAEYTRQPVQWVPYSDAGRLSDTDLTEGRNALNVMRFIAGVGIQDVTLCPYATYYAQCGALANYKNGALSHNPQFIQGMDRVTWAYAKLGAQNSNVSVGFNNPAHSVVMGYMYDTNEKNIGELGHRRWCLNPPMYLTGFGQVENFGAMWTTDKQLSALNSGICWPAQNMPTVYFPADTAWSVSMCENVPAENIKVTLTRKSDMRIWTFSKERSDGFFNVNNDSSLPLNGCIIFRPDDVGGYSHGDVFNVKIDGLDKEVSYNVNFFDLDGDDSIFDVPNDDETTSENSGKTVFIDEDTNIQITAAPDVFPADTQFKAAPIENCCSDTRCAYDISFVCNGQNIQPNGSVEVCVPIPKGFENYNVLRVYHVENGCCNFVPSECANGFIRFTANSFSPYIITSEDLDGQAVDFSDDDTPAEEPVENDEPVNDDTPIEEPVENDEPVNDDTPAEEPIESDEPVNDDTPAEEPIESDEPVNDDTLAEEPIENDEPVDDDTLAEEPVENDEPVNDDTPTEEPVENDEPINDVSPTEESVENDEPVNDDTPAEEPVENDEPVNDDSPTEEPVGNGNKVDEISTPEATESTSENDTKSDIDYLGSSTPKSIENSSTDGSESIEVTLINDSSKAVSESENPSTGALSAVIPAALSVCVIIAVQKRKNKR